MARPVFFQALRAAVIALAPVFLGAAVAAEPAPGIAMYGLPALPAGFTHLPYADPAAPKGGRIRFGESGSFDSLNPWILNGRPAQGIAAYVAEPLMFRSIDEPFTLYGLLAESVETDPDRAWVEFTLRPEAKFSDGNPVTVEDVIWSFETLGTEGHPRYRVSWGKVAKIEQTGPRSLRISFNTADRELPLIMGMRPVLEKAQWAGKDFASEMQMAPIGSGPYVIDTVETGRFITLKRNPDYWGKDLPVNAGRNNFDEMRWDYFGDGGVTFEAFKGGETDSYLESNAAKWKTDYDFPAVRDGRVILAEIPHQRPSGIMGLVMNTRKPLFADWRVREAMTLVFNFEFISKTLNGGTEPRITSYFANTPLAMQPGPATGKVAALLAPFAADLPPGTLEGYALPSSDGSELNRKNSRAALKLLAEAGWHVADDGVLRDAGGAPFKFDIVLQQGTAETQSIVDIYVEELRRIGIFPTVSTVDDAQYQIRKTNYDFDMTYMWVATSLSPGNEQYLYWGAKGVDEPGSRNLMGMKSPAAEAMIGAMLDARTPEDFTAAVRALDRVLTAGRYVIPFWYSKVTRIAYDRDLHFPESLPLYGVWPGFLPDVWWYEAEK